MHYRLSLTVPSSLIVYCYTVCHWLCSLSRTVNYRLRLTVGEPCQPVEQAQWVRSAVEQLYSEFDGRASVIHARWVNRQCTDFHSAILYKSNFNPRRAGGGCLDSPSCSRVSRHVKWPHIRKSFNARHSYTDRPIALRLDSTDLIRKYLNISISEFWYWWPKVRLIFRPLHFKSMGENWKAPFLTKTILNTLKHQVTGRLDTLNRKIAINDPSSCRWGHLRCCKVTSSLLAITCDRDKLERLKHHICFQVDDTDRSICNMTFIYYALCADLSKNVEKDKIWTLMTSGDLTFDMI